MQDDVNPMRGPTCPACGAVCPCPTCDDDHPESPWREIERLSDKLRRMTESASELMAERNEAREDRAMCLAENDRLILLNKELSDSALSASVRRVAEATADAHAECRAMAIREETAYNERDRMERERDEARIELADIHEQHERVVADRCPSDERHCGCVSFLRRELAEKDAEFLRFGAAHEKAMARVLDEANDHAERFALLQAWAEECGISPASHKLVTRLRENRACLDEKRCDRIAFLDGERKRLEAELAALRSEETVNGIIFDVLQVNHQHNDGEGGYEGELRRRVRAALGMPEVKP